MPRALLKASELASAATGALADAAATAVGGTAEDPMYMVVGFEVMACSIGRRAGEKPKDISCIDTLEGKPPVPQEITKGMGRSGDCLPRLTAPIVACPLAWSPLQQQLPEFYCCSQMQPDV